MMVPEDEGACVIEDMLRGTIELDWSMVDAQILMKSDGLAHLPSGQCGR
jgi:glutamyl-tRNA synthetase